MSRWMVRPGRTHAYAHYLLGLGLGIILGSLIAGALAVIVGVVFILVAGLVENSANKGDKNGKG